MAYTSQFTIYKSLDTGHPVLSGDTGSFLALLNACLITGYGTQVGAGWSKTGSVATLEDSASCGIFVMPTGSRTTLFVADNGPSTTCGTRQARITGYDSVTNFTASGTAVYQVTGSNIFPTVAQLTIGTGSVAVRKSATLTTAERQWILAADSSSIYGFFATGDTANTYYGFAFGDIYSIKSGSEDTRKTIIIGNIGASATATVTNDRLDALSLVNAATTGHFMQDSFGNVSGSLVVGKHGDGNKGSTTLLIGLVKYPNSSDNGLYISPVWVHESATAVVRGKMRGFWHALHDLASFADGETWVGDGEFTGRTFLMIKESPNDGVFLIETSATVETN